MMYKKDEEKKIIRDIYKNMDEMAAFAYQILGETLELKKNNGIYYAKTGSPFDDYYFGGKKQFAFNQDKHIAFPVQEREYIDYIEEEFLDEENLLIPTVDNKGKRYFEHYRIKEQTLKLVNRIENENHSFVYKINCLDEGYILVNKKQIYNYKEGELHADRFDHIYTKDTICFLKADDSVKEPLCEFVKKHDIALGVLSVKATVAMPNKRKKQERLAFVTLDRKGRPNSNLFYIEDYDIKQISLENQCYNDGVLQLQKELDCQAVSAQYEKEKLPKKINNALKKSLNK